MADVKGCCELYLHCGYFPDMGVEPGKYTIDENGVKRRMGDKVFKCLYDNKEINWNRLCPADRDRKERAERAEEETENAGEN